MSTPRAKGGSFADRLIVGVGTVALDTVETPSTVARDVPGGSAPYFAAAARAYGSVAIVGVVGDDFPGDALASLAAAGVEIDGVRTEAGSTFRWHVRYDAEGRRETVSVNRGVSLRVPPTLLLHHRNAAALFLGSTDPDIQSAVLDQAGSPGLVVLDTMTHWVTDRRSQLSTLLKRVDVLLVNEEEVRALGDTDDEAAAASAALRAGVEWVVVKRGAQGARAYYAPKGVLPIKLAPVAEVGAAPASTMVDPTGAGDAFAGGFVGVLARRGGRAALAPDTVSRAMNAGARLGALAVQSFSYDALLQGTDPDIGGGLPDDRVPV